MSKRHFSSLELNHLKKYGFSNIDLESIGEKPVEYVTGHAECCDLDFFVNESTLIPRLESEKIVQISLDHIQEQSLLHPAIADLGTGSGCLGLTIAVKLSQKQIPYTIYLSDISQEALKVAQKNASNLLPSTTNLFFEQSNLFDNYPKIKFDIILANLPYIPSAYISTLPLSVKDFEPRTALDGGPQGTTLINRLLQQLPSFLSEHGVAILEINDTHSLHDFTISPSLTTEIKTDLYQKPRFLVLHPKS